MRIELKEPYTSLYRLAYLRRDSSGRGRVDLINSKTDRTTISYAKFLVETTTGDFVPSGYDVDHINGDCSDDDLSNLQILDRKTHIAKSALERAGRTTASFSCPNCGLNFTKEKRVATSKKKNIFCSRSCNGKFNYSTSNLSNLSKISEEKILEIKSLNAAGLSGYRIAKITGISANTVNKYRKELAPIPE